MQKLKTFFRTFKNSLTNFTYYKDVAKAQLKFSFKYLFFLFYIFSLIGGIIFTIQMSIFVLPQVPAFVENIKSKAQTLYPKDLVVKIKEGQVSTNVKEPYVIENFLTIDTSASPSDFKNQTPVLVTKNSLVIADKDNSYRVYPIDDKTNYTIDKTAYDAVATKILPYLQYAQPAVIALLILSILIWPFIASLFAFAWQLFYLLIFSGLFLVFVKLMKKDLPYKKIYQLAIHASTLPILLSFLTGYLTIQMPVFLGTAILFVFMVLVVNQF